MFCSIVSVVLASKLSIFKSLGVFYKAQSLTKKGSCERSNKGKLNDDCLFNTTISNTHRTLIKQTNETTATKILITNFQKSLSQSSRPKSGKEASSLDGKTLNSHSVRDLAGRGMEINRGRSRDTENVVSKRVI